MVCWCFVHPLFACLRARGGLSLFTRGVLLYVCFAIGSLVLGFVFLFLRFDSACVVSGHFVQKVLLSAVGPMLCICESRI